jgi:2,5-diketo-D-gluconate reductase B
MTWLQGEGSVKHVGVSNFPPSMVEEATEHAAFFCNQVEYHAYRAQDELLEQARDGLPAHGLQPRGEGAVALDTALQEIGETHSKAAAQVALRWLIQQEKVAAIPKAASENHLRSNFDIFNFELSDEEMERNFELRR